MTKMLKFPPLKLIVFSIIFQALIATPVNSATEESDSKFAALSDQFMKEALARSPSNASQAGYHQHKDPKTGKTLALDSMLDDMSLKAAIQDREFYERFRALFAKETPLASLSPQDAADWRLIDDQIGLYLLSHDQIENHKHNPTVVVEMIGSAVFQPLFADYAEKELRFSHVIERIGQIPRALNQAKQYLDNAPAVYIATAIKENDGNISLIKETVAKKVATYPELKAKFDQLAPPAISALEDFSQWLKTDLAGRKCSYSWRLGKDLYRKKFKLVMQTDVDPDQLLADAEAELEKVRRKMCELALPMHKQMYPDCDHKGATDQERKNLIISEVLDKIGANHPKRDCLIEAVKADLSKIKQFISDKKIVSLSTRDNLKVIPTPAFMRGIYTVAGFHSAPPLTPEGRAEYWVTPIDPKTPEEKAESKLREYNDFTLKWLTIHEALPGHYIQFEHLNNILPERRRLLRSLYGNGAYIEGWAEYIAQVMMDEGFMKEDPRFAMIMGKIRLRLLANTILDVKMHTQNMTDKEALDLMIEKAFQTQAEAEGKLTRAKLSSAQLPTYYVGLREWLAFRKRYQERTGDKFDLLEFHNLALDQGPLPVPVVEELLR